MDVGIGLPAVIAGTKGELILEWARKADAGPFSSLGLVDRLVYANYESLITLAAAAGATRRIRLLTSVLLAPLRPGALLAKEAASLDALSGGRLTLGLGVGGREDDFQAAGVDFHTRGKRFDEQLEVMHRIWAGEPLSETVGRIGPAPAQPGGPRVLIGGNSPQAIRRTARWGDGYISGGGGPQQAQQTYNAVEQAWKAAGRAGKPRFVGGMYYALGPDAAVRAAAYIRDYYSFLGPIADAIGSSVAATPEAVKEAIKLHADVGMDEVVLWPCIAELDQVDRLRELL